MSEAEEREERQGTTDRPVKRTHANISLPSGLKGIIRRMKMKELNQMTARSTVRKGNILEKLFQGVWTETAELGIYEPPFAEFPKDSNNQPVLDWQRILQGDRNVLLMEIRKLVRGSSFDFDITCKMCRQIIRWTIDLSQLEVYPLSNEAKDQLRTSGKNEFLVTLPYSGDEVSFKLMQGVDQNAMAKASIESPDDQYTISTVQRLVYIPGAEKPQDRKEYVEEMDPEDADFLRTEWQSMDCDVQTTTSVECTTCGKIQQVSLPLDEDFLFKRSSRMKKR